MSRRLVSERTYQWMQYARGRSDAQRAVDVAGKIRRQIELWEQIRLVEQWTPVTALDSRIPETKDHQKKSGLTRYCRRFVRVLEQAGLIEVRLRERGFGGQITEFRRIKQRHGGPLGSSRPMDCDD